MKVYVLAGLSIVALFSVPLKTSAQTTPYCATNIASVLFIAPDGVLLSSNKETWMGLRQSFGQGITYDFKPENIIVNGFQITLDARGIVVPFSTIPVAFTSLGILPAGNYSVVVQPIATNVLPNVVCPTFTVPLLIPQGAQITPVPTLRGLSLLLLGGLLGLIGVLGYRPRFALRRRGR